MKKKLFSLLNDLPIHWETESQSLEIPIEGVEYDSRQVSAGSIFVALPGSSFDGHSYIKNAIGLGASVVVGSQPWREWQGLSVPYIQVDDTRAALAYLAASFYDSPAKKMVVIGVTGTDGKTTTCNLIYQILKTAGLRVGMISTVNAQIGDEILDTGFHVTTPEAPSIQFYLYKMQEAGITHVILETTSHGLAQKRVFGCEYDIAVITNVTHEHLDFHGSYESYLETKAQLVRMLTQTAKKESGAKRLAILNKDDQSYSYLIKMGDLNFKSYALTAPADIWAEEIIHLPAGTEFIACSNTFRIKIQTNLPGDFNISNCLAAISTAVYGFRIDHNSIAEGIRCMSGVPGRMQVIEMGQRFTAIVDFAHTPNALEKALQTARQMTKGRVIAVFGSAGLRDKQKRRMMAAISAQKADVTILTAEDPRTEDLAEILQEMQEAAIKNGAILHESLFVVADRGAAIAKAVDLAQPNDLIIACGKGHEQSMCFGEIEYPWDDRIAMQAALAEKLAIPGPEMPFLPTRKR